MILTTELSASLLELNDDELGEELTRPAEIEYMLLVNNIAMNRILGKLCSLEEDMRQIRGCTIDPLTHRPLGDL